MAKRRGVAKQLELGEIIPIDTESGPIQKLVIHLEDGGRLIWNFIALTGPVEAFIEELRKHGLKIKDYTMIRVKPPRRRRR